MATRGQTAIDLFRPLELIDVGGLYARHALTVDFVVYLVLFNGVAQVAFLRRLDGKGGRLVAGAVGVALALAMTGVEAATGFSLLALGGVAAGILLFLVGAGLYRVLRQMGASAVTAGALSLVVVVLGVEAAVPDFSARISGPFPYLDLVAGLCILVLAWKGLHHLMPSGSAGRLEGLAKELTKGPAVSSSTPGRSEPQGEGRIQRVRRELRLEKTEIGRHLVSITKKERKSCRQVRDELKSIRRVLETGRHDEGDRRKIAEALSRIPPARHELRERLEAVRELDRRLGRFDVGLLRELREAWDKVPPAQRETVRRLALEQRAKLRGEERIQALEAFVAEYDAGAALLLEKGVAAVTRGDVAEALSLVRAAEAREEGAAERVQEILEIDRELRRITRLELRQARRAS